MRHRFKSIVARVKGKLKHQASQLAYEHLNLPLKEKTFELAQDQCLAHAAQAFTVFGHTTLRGVLTRAELEAIGAGLTELGGGLAESQTVTVVSPVEKSRVIQDVVFQPQLLSLFQKILSPFWYYSSDAFTGFPVFSRHRDTFLNPPFYKIFIPLVPCTFSVIPGSRKAGDIYAREVGKYATGWDSGDMLSFPVSEVHIRSAEAKVVADVSSLTPEEISIHRRLVPGDIFIFCQNAVHGLIAQNDKNWFLSISVVPSPTTSVRYGLTRTEHLECIVNNIVATAVVNYQLSSLRNVNPEESLFMGYTFNEQDLNARLQDGNWNDCFGLRFIEKEKWVQALQSYRFKGIQHIQNEL